MKYSIPRYVILTLQCRARGCWKWQGSILYPSSKTMDRLSGKWEEDSTNIAEQEWRKMAPSGKVASTRHNPHPLHHVIIYRGDSAFGYCTKKFSSDLQTDNLTKWVMHAILISCSLWLLIFTIIDTRSVGVGSSSSLMGWGGDGGGGLYQPSVNLKLRLFCLSLAFYHTYRSRRWHLCISFTSASRECNPPPLPEKKKTHTHKRETLKYCNGSNSTCTCCVVCLADQFIFMMPGKQSVTQGSYSLSSASLHVPPPPPRTNLPPS